jgi:hypothetical protein
MTALVASMTLFRGHDTIIKFTEFVVVADEKSKNCKNSKLLSLVFRKGGLG